MAKYSGRSGGDENLTINLTVSGQEAAEREVKTFVNTLNTILRGAGKYNIDEYFDSANASIENVRNTLRMFMNDMDNADRAGDFLKSYGAYIAQFDGSLTDAANHIKNEFGDSLASNVGTTFNAILSSAEKIAPEIAQVFDPSALKDAYSSFTYVIKELGADVSKIFSAANAGDTSGLRAQIEELTADLSDARWQIQMLEQQIEELGDSALNQKLKQFESTARAMSIEFKSLLRANGVDDADIGMFSKYIHQIESGTITVKNAFAQARQELGHLFTTPLDAGGLEEALTRIENKIDRVTNKTGQLGGVSGSPGATGAASGVTEHVEKAADATEKEIGLLEKLAQRASALDALVEALKLVADGMAKSGESATSAIDSVNRLVESITKLGDVDVDKLERVSSIMSSLSGIGNLKAGTTNTDNVIRLVSSINSIGNGSGVRTLQTLAGINFERLSKLRVSGKSITYLGEQLPKIADSGVVNNLKELAEINWSNLSNLKVSKSAIDNLEKLRELFGGQSQFKFDEAGMSSLSQTIQDAITKASANIKLTIDNVELSAKARQNVTSAAQNAASNGANRSGGSVGGRLDRLSMEAGQLSPDLSLRSTDIDIVNAYTIAWKQLMAELKAVSSLSDDDILSGLSGLSQHTNDLKVMRAEFNQLSQIITSIEKLDPSVALKTTDVGQLKQYGDMWTQVSDRIREAIELIKHGTMPDMNGIRMLMDQLTKAKDAYNAVYDAQIKLESIKPDTLKDLGVEQIDAYKAKWAELSEMISQTLANIASGEPIDIKGIQSALNGLQTMRDEYNQLYDMQQKLAAVSPDKLGGALPEDKVDAYTQAYNNLTEAIGRALAAEGTDRSSVMAQIRATTNDLLDEANGYIQVAREASKTIATQQQAAKLADKIDIWTDKNPKAYKDAKAQVDEWLSTLRSETPIASEQIRKISTDFQHLSMQEKMAGNNGQTFFQTLKAGWSKFGGWSLVSRSFMSVIRIFKQAVTAVKEVDAAMTELKKVTDETASGYERFYDKAITMASKVGAKLSDVVQSASEFARLGYSLAEATELTEAALVYQNVADGLENVSEATSSLISTIKAFGEETYTAMEIVDMFNEVGKTLLPMPVVTRCLVECYIGQSSIALCA